jgi:hypothetical protein
MAAYCPKFKGHFSRVASAFRIGGRKMHWYRVWEGTPTDPKFRLIARKSGRHITWVLSVFQHMMDCANAASERGTLEGWTDDIVAVCLDLETQDVAAIRTAMQGTVLNGNRLSGWDKRQRVSDDVAERVRRHREKAKAPPTGGGSANGSGEHRNGAHPEGNVDVTLQKQDETLPPLRAQTPELQTEESIPPVDLQKPSPAPIGAGGGFSEFKGKNFHLSAKTVAEYQRDFHAIPDLTAALRMLDADLAGRKPDQVYGALLARLNGMHQNRLDKMREARAAKQPKQSSRAGIRKLGGRNAA